MTPNQPPGNSNSEPTRACIDGRNKRTRHTTRARLMAGVNAHGMYRKYAHGKKHSAQQGRKHVY